MPSQNAQRQTSIRSVEIEWVIISQLVLNGSSLINWKNKRHPSRMPFVAISFRFSCCQVCGLRVPVNPRNLRWMVLLDLLVEPSDSLVFTDRRLLRLTLSDESGGSCQHVWSRTVKLSFFLCLWHKVNKIMLYSVLFCSVPSVKKTSA